jgi:hypothetical protein
MPRGCAASPRAFVMHACRAGTSRLNENTVDRAVTVNVLFEVLTFICDKRTADAPAAKMPFGRRSRSESVSP